MVERLPQEVIIGILSRLPITSLMLSKLVCRAWRRLIQDTLFASEHFSHMADNNPTFILQSLSPDREKLFFTDLSHDSQGNLISKKPPSPVMQLSLIDSCNGLLCMHDDRTQAIYICNPFTKLSIELPKLVNPPPKMEVDHLEFGFHPITKEYKLVYRELLGRRDSPSELCSKVHVLTIGNGSWRNVGAINHRFFWQPSNSKVIANGRLHWISRPYNNERYSFASLLVSFDLETEQFQDVPKPDCCNIDYCFHHHLMILRGCLSLSAYQTRELGIWVMKEYGVKESWIKEFNIGTYFPRAVKESIFPRNPIVFPDTSVQVICSLKSGEILLEYRCRLLVLYDPQQGTFKELTILEIPESEWFKTIVHFGSLNWLDTPIY
ncbi:hypothetical protein COLO4_25859 [Corchorus olitorius]|uniref:F-box domain-containing protein n=1 Tax=Corchorus olitorius TaxID=93759 RepID=A0A1R3HZP4_9ROSI|nr:hypothetical protein COLO4_25859 [Corchorus olitorius]